jgi:hypothetical protein
MAGKTLLTLRSTVGKALLTLSSTVGKALLTPSSTGGKTLLAVRINCRLSIPLQLFISFCYLPDIQSGPIYVCPLTALEITGCS